MKKRKSEFIKKTVSLLFFCGLIINISFAQDLKTIMIQSTQLKPEDIVYLNSSFYDATFITWGKNEIRTEYHLYIEGNKADVKDFYNNLNKLMKKQLMEASAQKNISLPIKNFQRTNRKITIKLNNDHKKFTFKKFEVALTVHTPKTNALNIKCDFNKIIISNLDADVKLDINSAKLTMGDCNNLNLKANFCKNMNLGEVEKAKIDINSCSINIGGIANDLQLKANFSTINIGDISGNAAIDMNSSGFKTQRMQELDLNGSFLRYFKVQNVKNAKIQVSSSKITINQVDAIELTNTSFSNFKLNSIHSMSIASSNSSEFDIGSIKNCSINQASFSNFKIDKLSGSFSAKANSGSIEIDQIMKDFKKIEIDGQFIDIDLSGSSHCEFQLEAFLTFPNYNFEDIKYDRKIQNLNTDIITGYKGNLTDELPLIKFNCKSCDIKLQ